jgi:hypothetical protein
LGALTLCDAHCRGQINGGQNDFILVTGFHAINSFLACARKNKAAHLAKPDARQPFSGIQSRVVSRDVLTHVRITSLKNNRLVG